MSKNGNGNNSWGVGFWILIVFLFFLIFGTGCGCGFGIGSMGSNSQSYEGIRFPVVRMTSPRQNQIARQDNHPFRFVGQNPVDQDEEVKNIVKSPIFRHD